MSKEKSVNNPTDKPKKPVKRIITTSLLCVVFAAVGGMGGYVLYSAVHPYEDVVVVSSQASYDREKLVKSLTSGSILDDYKDHVYDVINYSMDLQAESPYSLVLGDGLVDAAAGVKQTIKAGTYVYPEGFYQEKVSQSSIVHAADRYYADDNSYTIKGYECSYEKEWSSSLTAKDYTYDSYIQKFGKLNKGTYYCTNSEMSDDRPIPETFLSLKKEDFDNSTDATKHSRNGVMYYTVSKESVSGSIFEKKGEGYHIEVDINPLYGVSFMRVNMKGSGRLKAMPNFTSCRLYFDLDKDLYLISSNFHDEYRVNTGGLVTNATSNLYQTYFRSANSTFTSLDGSESVDIIIPDMDDLDFNGYQLFLKEA